MFFITTLSHERLKPDFKSKALPAGDEFYSEKMVFRSMQGNDYQTQTLVLNSRLRSLAAKQLQNHSLCQHTQLWWNRHFKNNVAQFGKIRRERKTKTGVWPWETKENMLYGPWNKWSSCSRTCITQRYRRCLYSEVCGTNYQRDIAYCYTDGSTCDDWVRMQIFQPKKNGNKGNTKKFWLRNRSSVLNETKTLQCGVSANIRLMVPNLKIVGGRPAARGRWPWQVAVLNKMEEVYCGGTLISPKWVLTAAHCLRSKMFIRIGEHDLNFYEGTETNVKVSKVLVHPNYNQETVDADIALLMLPHPVAMESKPSHGSLVPGIACLPHWRQQLPFRQLCITTGWGKSDVNHLYGTDVLHEVQVSILSAQICRNVHRRYRITDNMFCAGNKRRPADSCAGDSGGPLLCKNRQGRWTVFGITSFGDGCGTKGKFGIYVKVAQFTKWIHSVMSRYK